MLTAVVSDAESIAYGRSEVEGVRNKADYVCQQHFGVNDTTGHTTRKYVVPAYYTFICHIISSRSLTEMPRAFYINDAVLTEFPARRETGRAAAFNRTTAMLRQYWQVVTMPVTAW